ncbi:MAG: RNA methyltransferase, partial [Clostridia bacterium]|nr:RNA methyltransferase [Clostridia bacterium]
VTGSLDGAVLPSEIDFTSGKYILCLGNEAHGVSDELVSLGGKKVKIPMPGKAESLNVAVAGAVLLYEAVRQGGNR